MWKTLFDNLWAVAGAAIAAVWAMLTGRIKAVEEKVEAKAETKEMDVQRGNVGKLFDECADIRKEMGAGFTAQRDRAEAMKDQLRQGIHDLRDDVSGQINSLRAEGQRRHEDMMRALSQRSAL